MAPAIHFSSDEKGIGRLIIDVPNEKVNVLSEGFFQELNPFLDEISKKTELKVLVIQSGKPDSFIAGADLHSFEKAFNDPVLLENSLKTGHGTFNKLASLPFPTIAVINGICVGGGLEFALACTFRVVSDHPKTSLGLPETTIGVFPAWGGSNRLPRLIGLTEGMQMILSGKAVNAQKAFKLKLADAIVPWEFLDLKVGEFVSLCTTAKGRQKILDRRVQKDWKSYLLEKNPVGRAIIFNQAKKGILNKTKGHYPAPLVALNVIQETYPLPLEQGLVKEIEMAKENIPVLGKVSKHLVRLFFTQEALKKDPGVSGNVEPVKVNSGAVIGAGTMGGGIAWLFSNYDLPIRMKDISWDVIAKGNAAIQKVYQKLVKIRKLTPAQANLKFHKISTAIDYSGFHDVDIVIEAAVENLDLKRKIFSEIEEVVRPDTIITSNTSSLTIAEMSEGMKHPERFLATHFFNPVDRMPLVEIVAGKTTSPKAIVTAVELCKKLGKTPIVVGDCTGFLVNRIFVLGANEICWMLQEGASMELLEKTMVDFGMPMSPFLLSDEVGTDVGYKVSHVFEKAYGARMKCPPIIEKMYEQKLFGKKNGKGFYVYNKKKPEPNPEVQLILKSMNVHSKEFSSDDIRDRVLFVMVNEAARCLEEKIVEKPSYLDMAMIMGTGFPPFRGGLLAYADERGVDTVVDRLKEFENKWGSRYEPSAALLKIAQTNKKFYQ